MIFLLAAGVIALVAFSFSVERATRALLRSIDASGSMEEPSFTESRLREIERGLDENSAKLEDLTLGVAEGIKRVDRAENRVQKTVTSARRQLREAGLEHAGIEAEFEELHTSDEGGSEDQGVLPLQEAVVRDGPSGIPGISRSQLQAMREA